MLAKLTKLDLKSTSRYFLPIYAATLILAAVSLLCLLLFSKATGDFATSAISSLRVIWLLSIWVFDFLVLIIPVLRFKSSVINDEAYIILSLPVSAWKHIVSKLVCTVVWYVFAGIYSLVANMFISWLYTYDDTNDITFSTLLDTQNLSLSLQTVLSATLSLFSTLVFIICIQLFLFGVLMITSSSKRHSGAMNVLLVIIGANVMGGIYGAYLTFVNDFYQEYLSEFMPNSVMSAVTVFNAVFFLFFGVLFYIFVVKYFRKKYDLQ